VDVGHGLRNMRERVERLGGAFTLTSRPGDGSQVTIELELAAADIDA
jgi:signal transduction histidine kinase